MKKMIMLLLVMLFISGCSSSAAGQSHADDTAAGNGSSGFVIEPEPDEGDVSSDTYGQTVVDTDDLWIPEDDDSGSSDVLDVSEADFDVSKLNFEEFDNLYGEMMYTGIPEDRVAEPLKQANGVWRYNLKIRFDSAENGYMFDELGYAVMSVNGSNDPPIVIELHPRLAAYDGYEVYPETDEEVGYEPFKGTLEDDEIIRLYGNDLTLIPEYFYAYEGREYFIAHLYKGEEFFADFMMIRGQD